MGIYKKYGLDVTIKHAAVNEDPFVALVNGKVDFAVSFLANGIICRSNGFRIVDIGQIVNGSNTLLISRESSHIKKLSDIKNKKVGIWNNGVGQLFLTLFHNNNIPIKRYDQSSTMSLFLNKGIDVCSAMSYNEYHMLYYAGLDNDELNIIKLKDLGYGIPEDAIFCLESMWKKDSALAKAITDATIQGWIYAKTHPAEANRSVMKRVRSAKRPVSEYHMRYMLNAIMPSIIPDGKNNKYWEPGMLSKEDYNKCVSILKKSPFIGNDVPEYELFFKYGK